MFDPNLPLLKDAVRKLAPFLGEIVFVGGVIRGLLITDEAAAPIRGTTDVDVIAEILTYADYIAFSERLREVRFTEDTELTVCYECDRRSPDGSNASLKMRVDPSESACRSRFQTASSCNG